MNLGSFNFDDEVFIVRVPVEWGAITVSSGFSILQTDSTPAKFTHRVNAIKFNRKNAFRDFEKWI